MERKHTAMELLDFHAHILPHMDHGSKHTATACEQMRLIAAAGVSEVCATSHFYPQDTLAEAFLRERTRSREHLLHTLEGIPRPRLLMGAEVLICPGLEEMPGLPDLCIEGTRVLLLEMPFTTDAWNRKLYETICRFRLMNITPVLAHVDRYPRHLIDELFDDGAVGQINADALDHLIKPRHMLRWIDEGHIVALGSDLHGSNPKAYSSFVKLATAMPDRVGRIMNRTAALLAGAVRY